MKMSRPDNNRFSSGQDRFQSRYGNKPALKSTNSTGPPEHRNNFDRNKSGSGYQDSNNHKGDATKNSTNAESTRVKAEVKEVTTPAREASGDQKPKEGNSTVKAEAIASKPKEATPSESRSSHSALQMPPHQLADGKKKFTGQNYYHILLRPNFVFYASMINGI